MSSRDALEMIAVRSQCYFTRAPDMSTFLEDVCLIRPTEMLVPPRITSMMYDHFQELLGAKSASSAEEREQQRQASPEPTEPEYQSVHQVNTLHCRAVLLSCRGVLASELPLHVCRLQAAMQVVDATALGKAQEGIS